MSITTAFQSIALAAVASAAAAAEPQGNPERNAYPRPPVFLIVAAKEPDGANLDRIQVVKGWVQDGKPTEQIYNVAWSGDRQMDKGGKLPPVGNTVEAKSASYNNSIGEARWNRFTTWPGPVVVKWTKRANCHLWVTRSMQTCITKSLADEAGASTLIQRCPVGSKVQHQ